MKVLDLTDRAYKVNSFYNNNIQKFENIKKKIQAEIQNNNNKISDINININYKKEEVKRIKDDPNNHYGKNIDFCLLFEKEKEVDILMKEIEDLEKKKNVYENGYKEIDNLLKYQDQQYSENIMKFKNEREEIRKSIINQAYYNGILIRVAEEQILEENISNNDGMVSPFI